MNPAQSPLISQGWLQERLGLTGHPDREGRFRTKPELEAYFRSFAPEPGATNPDATSRGGNDQVGHARVVLEALGFRAANHYVPPRGKRDQRADFPVEHPDVR
jgi:hypothetical protein